MYKIRDKFIYECNGDSITYAEIININEYREPSLRYGVDLYSDNGYEDTIFVDESFLDELQRVTPGEDDVRYEDILKQLRYTIYPTINETDLTVNQVIEFIQKQHDELKSLLTKIDNEV